MANIKATNRSILIGALFMVVLLTSCIDYVTNVPPTEPKLVVNSFICPGDSIKIEVYESNPIAYNRLVFDENDRFKVVEDAAVTITSLPSGQSKQVPYNATLRLFVLPPSEFAIEMGVEYKLNVEAAGLKPVVAQTTVPMFKPDMKSISIEKTKAAQYEYDMEEYKLIGSVQDVGGEENYYSCNFTTYNFLGIQMPDLDSLFSVNQSNKIVFSDKGKDGGLVYFMDDYIWGGFTKIEILIQSVDYAYYKYHTSLDNADFNDNPFSEPTPLYSNIEGGLGVFASYTKQLKTLNFPNPNPKVKYK